ncbi:hypothetical protein EHS25_006886 [Saitozyma podzolica]|uniref:Uncharacterized protein n=1 Tax=Saitozyma podzolica TaxID=1890683 RepID=A0A427XRC1_9TREE|nr:hypothetical protein EHS25_006886 [Saitozyma podzolica]
MALERVSERDPAPPVSADLQKASVYTSSSTGPQPATHNPDRPRRPEVEKPTDQQTNRPIIQRSNTSSPPFPPLTA